MRHAAAGSVSVGKVPADEPPRLDASEIARCQVPQEVSPTQARVAAEATKMGLSTAYFWRVRSDYYEQELAWRRDVLGAASVTQLCKSMIMENTKVSDLTHQQAVESGRVKYVCVVLQYAGAKLQKEKLTDAIRRMEGSKAVGKKQYSLRMVSMEVSDELSGYTHNVRTNYAPLEPWRRVLSGPCPAEAEARALTDPASMRGVPPGGDSDWHVRARAAAALAQDPRAAGGEGVAGRRRGGPQDAGRSR